MNLLPSLYIRFSVFTQFTHSWVVAAVLVHRLVEREHDHLEETTFVLREGMDVGEVFHEWRLRQSQFAFTLILIAELKVDFERPGLADLKLLC